MASSMRSRWFFSSESLNATPSIRGGQISKEKELSYRQQAANFIQDMGQRLQVTQLCINTAIVYMQRFYMFHSFARFHRNTMAASALFLAAKVEEQPRKLEHVIKVAHICLHRDKPNLDPRSEEYAEQAAELVANENILLQTLGFDVAIDHPHTHVVRCCQLVKASKELAQTSYFMATNSLHLTTMCLRYRPTVVACVCIHLACKWSNYVIPESSEGKKWFSYVDANVSLELLDQLTNEFLAIFEKCPSRLKKKIMASTEATKAEEERRKKGDISSSQYTVDYSKPKAEPSLTSSSMNSKLISSMTKSNEKLGSSMAMKRTYPDPINSEDNKRRKTMDPNLLRQQQMQQQLARQQQQTHRYGQQQQQQQQQLAPPPSTSTSHKSSSSSHHHGHHHHHHSGSHHHRSSSMSSTSSSSSVGSQQRPNPVPPQPSPSGSSNPVKSHHHHSHHHGTHHHGHHGSHHHKHHHHQGHHKQQQPQQPASSSMPKPTSSSSLRPQQQPQQQNRPQQQHPDKRYSLPADVNRPIPQLSMPTIGGSGIDPRRSQQVKPQPPQRPQQQQTSSASGNAANKRSIFDISDSPVGGNGTGAGNNDVSNILGKMLAGSGNSPANLSDMSDIDMTTLESGEIVDTPTFGAFDFNLPSASSSSKSTFPSNETPKLPPNKATTTASKISSLFGDDEIDNAKPTPKTFGLPKVSTSPMKKPKKEDMMKKSSSIFSPPQSSSSWGSLTADVKPKVETKVEEMSSFDKLMRKNEPPTMMVSIPIKEESNDNSDYERHKEKKKKKKDKKEKKEKRREREGSGSGSERKHKHKHKDKDKDRKSRNSPETISASGGGLKLKLKLGPQSASASPSGASPLKIALSGGDSMSPHTSKQRKTSESGPANKMARALGTNLEMESKYIQQKQRNSSLF